MRDALRWILILAICAGMVALCVFWFDFGGLWGLIGGGAGFLFGVMGAHPSWGERLGNGYVGALMGLSVGIVAGALALMVWPYVWALAQRAMAQ